eukprot:gene30333-37530_t
MIQQDDVDRYLQIIRQAVEEGIVADDDLLQSMLVRRASVISPSPGRRPRSSNAIQMHTWDMMPEIKTIISHKSAGGELDLVSEFVRLVSVILSVAKQLPEEAYLYSIKLVAEVNFQFPLPEDNSCEIATCFSRIDSHEEGVNISQGLLHLLNENGYPNISEETPAILRLCTDLLYVHSTSEEKKKKSSSGSREKHDEISLNKGHFYTNDIKILIDLILREMRNIPYNCEETATYSAGQIALHGQVRYMYLELIDAILQESGWSSAGQCYLWADLKALIEELYNQEEDCEKRDFAYALLYKYKHYFVTR